MASDSTTNKTIVTNFLDDHKKAVASMSLRAPRAGDQFYVEKAQEKRYDEEEKLGLPRRIVEWIVRVLGGSVQAPPSLDWKTLQNYLRDGVVLCKLINALRKAADMPPVHFKKKATITFMALSNLENFLRASQDLGVSEVALFQPSDLYEGKKAQLLCALNCLDALGRLSNLRGFRPEYEEAQPPKADWCKDDE